MGQRAGDKRWLLDNARSTLPRLSPARLLPAGPKTLPATLSTPLMKDPGDEADDADK